MNASLQSLGLHFLLHYIYLKCKMLLPLRPLSVDGDLERPLEVSLLRPPLNNKLTKVLERCRVLFSSGSFPFCFFSFFCLISVIGQRTISHRFHFN